MFESTEERRPNAKEASILDQFCADAGPPAVPFSQLYLYLRPPCTGANGDGRTFQTGQKMVKHASNLRAFRDLLHEAMELRAIHGQRGNQ